MIVFHCNRFTYEYTQLQWKEVPRIKISIYVNETVNFTKFDDAMEKNIFREHKSRLQCRSALTTEWLLTMIYCIVDVCL